MLDTVSKYVYEVYRCKSVSAAAKKMYLSQPAISTAIKKAEEELGAPIFNRKTIPFSLTPEGKVYIETIEKILLLEDQTHDRIQDMREFRGGLLNIATSTNLSYYVIPKICEQFRLNYPHVDIRITTTQTNQLPGMLAKGTADLVFVPTEESAPGFTIIPLLVENLVVAVRRDFDGIHPLLPFALTYEDVLNRDFSEEKQIRDMSVFRGIDFIYAPPDSNIFRKRKLIFGDSGSAPFINVNQLNQRLNYNLMRSGFGAFLTTDADVATMPPDENCIYFALHSPAAKQSFSIAHGKHPDAPTYKLVEEFIRTAKAFFNCENPLKNFM